jgi:protein CpxP
MRRIPAHFRRLALVIVLALLVTPVLAQGPAGRGPGHGHFRGADRPMHERMFEQLDLTDDQRVQIDQLMTDHRSAMKDRREQMRTHRMEMRDLVHADEFDEAAIRDAAMAIAEAEAEMAVERARLRQEIHKVLTPEQQEKAAELFQKRREFMQQHGRDFRGGRHFHGGQHRHGAMPDYDDD